MRFVWIVLMAYLLGGCALPFFPVRKDAQYAQRSPTAEEVESDKLAQARKKDQKLLDVALNLATEESLQDYLDNCVECEAQAEVLLKLTVLREERIRQEQEAQAQDRLFWSWTEKADAPFAYQNYIQHCGACEFRDLALARVNKKKKPAAKVTPRKSDKPATPKTDKPKIAEVEGSLTDTGRAFLPQSNEEQAAQSLTAVPATSKQQFVPSRSSAELINELLATMVTVPKGKFMMGDARQKSESPLHEVTLKTFQMMAVPVTNELWQSCVAAAECPAIEIFFAQGWEQKPVMGVSYDDVVQRFIPWLVKQSGKPFVLPTEAQWEYAARAGVATNYTWGDEPQCANARYGRRRNGECSSTEDGPAPVQSFLANDFGLYDMQGNVWEWVADCWNPNYQGAPTDGSAWNKGDCDRRVMRGGSWYSMPYLVRLAARTRGLTTYRLFNGFRLVLPAP